MRLKNILLVVSDIDKSKAFYKDLFGFTVVMDFGENVILSEGLVLQERQGWEAAVGQEAVFGSHNVELYFVENNLDIFLEKLENSPYHIEYVNTEFKKSWGKRAVRIYDPDRHMIEICEA